MKTAALASSASLVIFFAVFGSSRALLTSSDASQFLALRTLVRQTNSTPEQLLKVASRIVEKSEDSDLRTLGVYYRNQALFLQDCGYKTLQEIEQTGWLERFWRKAKADVRSHIRDVQHPVETVRGLPVGLREAFTHAQARFNFDGALVACLEKFQRPVWVPTVLASVVATGMCLFFWCRGTKPSWRA